MRDLPRLPAIAAAIVATLLSASCTTVSYYSQAIHGQIELWRLAHPIDELLTDSATPPALTAKLRMVRDIRNYASRELGLPDNGSYRNYADIRRPFVVWNVFATQELSLRPQEWCFLVVGCVGYRGYFSQQAAAGYAATLAAQGLDVYVGGVPAYSTLGWFDDPLLSTFIGQPESELARLIFHELAHQVAFANSDTAFNESFAVAVEIEGVNRWLAQRPDNAARQIHEIWQARRHDYLALIERYRGRLEELYRSAEPDDWKRERKAWLFDEIRHDYAALKAGWGGYSGYDRIFAAPLNNAFIASNAIYTQWVPAFQALLARQHGDLKAFYDAVRRLAKLPAAERYAALSRATAAPAGSTSNATRQAANSGAR